jgi:crossover junction endodeoxyribonuclease RuvC
MEVEYSALSPSEIKKHATGKGNAKKDAMIESARKKFPNIEIVDDNHADAIWIYDLATTLYHS